MSAYYEGPSDPDFHGSFWEYGFSVGPTARDFQPQGGVRVGGEVGGRRYTTPYMGPIAPPRKGDLKIDDGNPRAAAARIAVVKREAEYRAIAAFYRETGRPLPREYQHIVDANETRLKKAAAARDARKTKAANDRAVLVARGRAMAASRANPIQRRIDEKVAMATATAMNDARNIAARELRNMIDSLSTCLYEEIRPTLLAIGKAEGGGDVVTYATGYNIGVSLKKRPDWDRVLSQGAK